MFIKPKMIAVIAVCLLGVIVVAVINVQRISADNAALKQRNSELTAELKTLQVNHRLTEEAYTALAETRLQIRTQTQTVVKRIKASPKSNDAPLAPVLKSALEALP